MKTYFYECEKCGNIIMKIEDSGMKPFCCGSVMTELRPNTDETQFGDKHIPWCECSGCDIKVKIGATLHPSAPEHHIKWIYLETDQGGQLYYPIVGEAPVALFHLRPGEKAEAVYCYCNIHGLWRCDCKCACESDPEFLENDCSDCNVGN